MTRRINFDDGDIDARIYADQLGRDFRSIVKYTGQVGIVFVQMRHFDHMRIGNNMPVFVDKKTGAASRVKPADFDLYRDDRRANFAVDIGDASPSRREACRCGGITVFL